MKKRLLFLVFIVNIFLVASLNANSVSGKEIAQKLHLNAGYKAIAQWERVFSSPRKMKRYKIDTLSENERKILKEYLISHAIDSDHPTVAGEF